MFERLIETALRGLTLEEILVYLVDILVYSKNLILHIQKIRLLLQQLREANLLLQPEKVTLLQKEVVFLGHVISEKVVQLDPEKISAVKNLRTPKLENEQREYINY